MSMLQMGDALPPHFVPGDDHIYRYHICQHEEIVKDRTYVISVNYSQEIRSVNVNTEHKKTVPSEQKHITSAQSRLPQSSPISYHNRVNEK